MFVIYVLKWHVEKAKYIASYFHIWSRSNNFLPPSFEYSTVLDEPFAFNVALYISIFWWRVNFSFYVLWRMLIYIIYFAFFLTSYLNISPFGAVDHDDTKTPHGLVYEKCTIFANSLKIQMYGALSQTQFFSGPKCSLFKSNTKSLNLWNELFNKFQAVFGQILWAWQ